MRARPEGRWWGVALEAPDPRALADFYSRLLEWPVAHEEEGTSVLAVPASAAFLVVQAATGYVAPRWPPEPDRQRPMAHLDFQVDDLEAAVAEALALGATLSATQPNPQVRVLFNPAGHPFCLCRDEG